MAKAGAEEPMASWSPRAKAASSTEAAAARQVQFHRRAGGHRGWLYPVAGQAPQVFHEQLAAGRAHAHQSTRDQAIAGGGGQQKAADHSREVLQPAMIPARKTTGAGVALKDPLLRLARPPPAFSVAFLHLR